jgi:hypothetical protein
MSNSDNPLETAKDVSFVLLSNILIVLVILLLLISVIYYVTIGRKNDDNSDYFNYLKQQFNFDFSTKQSSSSSSSSSTSSSSNPSFFSKFNFGFNDVRVNFFKYPALLLLSSFVFVVLFSLPKKHIFFDTLKYSLPAMGLLYFFLIYKSFNTSYLDLNNFNLNRIKSVIIFFCVIATLLTFYIKDPGNFVSNNFGESIIIIIIISILTFMQLINVLILNRINPLKSYEFKRTFDKQTRTKKILNMASYFLYFVFIILMTFLMGSKYKDTEQFLPMLLSTIVIGIVWGAINIGLFYNNPIRGEQAANGEKLSKYFGIFIGISILILGIIASLKLIDDFAGKMTTLGKSISIIIILILMSALYKFIKAKYRTSDTKIDNIFGIIIEGVFYIPCILNNIFDVIYRLFYYLFTDEGKFAFYNEQDKISMLIIFFIISFFLLYVSIKKINNKLVTQNGTVLINHPISLNKQYHLGNFETLNKTTDYNYNYGISFWVYLHSNPSNNANNYYSILNYANKPNFLYNPNKHNFQVVCDISGSEIQETIYTNDNMPLQKWTNVIFNCNGGNMDIFIDNNLVKSQSKIIPFITIDALTLGENDGLNGGICNVVYFKTPLSIGNMFILYHSNKLKNPPISDISI